MNDGRWLDKTTDLEDALNEVATIVVVFQGSQEWSAVYLDGELQKIGDHYTIDEWLRAHFNVITVQADDFLRGQDTAEGSAQTLSEAIEYAKLREERLAEAKSLRNEAARLLASAEILETRR